MYIKITENTPYPPLQRYPASGFIEFPDEFVPVFYPQDKQASGFVKLEVLNDMVTSCTWDEDAYQEWISLNKNTEPEPSNTDVLNALLGVTV